MFSIFVILDRMRRVTLPLRAVFLIVYLAVFNWRKVYMPSPTEVAAITEQKLIIDHDGGADDAMAIFMALLYERYFDGPGVVAVTTCHGNVNELQAFINTQRILDVAKIRNIPIYRGSNFPLVDTFYSGDQYFGVDGLGDNDYDPFDPIEAQTAHAVHALIYYSKKFTDKLIVTSIGPLTNIALAIRLDPEFISRIGHLYIGTGNIYDEDNPDPEFNALIDVEAYHVVARNARPDKVTVVPFSQVLSSLSLTREWRMDVLGTISTDIIRALNLFERVSIAKDDTWAMLDPAVMAAVLNKNVINQTVYTINDIILCGENRGLNTNNFSFKEESNMKLIYSANEAVYKETLINIFSSELPQHF